MNPFLKQFHFYTRSQRAGILMLFVVIILLQLSFLAIDSTTKTPDPPEKAQWLALQKQIDSMKQIASSQTVRMYPFNPNFISDFKGYQLGMSVEQIDRLHEFREQGRFVNSAAEFQQVTGVPDSLLHKIAPYFKFPEWVKNQKQRVYKHTPKTPVVRKDINLATSEDLIAIYGIGPALSERILKFRTTLGGFVSMEQMQDVYGLSPEVIEKLNERFFVVDPIVPKIKINDASISELSKFPYFRYPLSKQIVTYRSMNGRIDTTEDLLKVSGFPSEKVGIIALYLEF